MDEANKLPPVIYHFINGGNLWAYDRHGIWFKQIEIFIDPDGIDIYNIIEDEYFELRKAHALGKVIEGRRIDYENQVWEIIHEPTWNNIYEYRGKI